MFHRTSPGVITHCLDHISSHDPGEFQFSFTRFLDFTPPNNYRFSYDESAQQLSIRAWHQHCVQCGTADDPCLHPLIALAQADPQTRNQLPAQPALHQVETLSCLDVQRLSRLTKPQREKLSTIHQNTSIQLAIQSAIALSTEKTFIHGDYRLPHILFREEPAKPQLHIIDWEYGGLGPRVYDWSTLMADYITLTLTHYVETAGKPTELTWSQLEQCLRRHLATLRETFHTKPETLTREYFQWIGMLLLAKSIRAIAQHISGNVLSDLLFQTGRRFLIEYQQLEGRYRS